MTAPDPIPPPAPDSTGKRGALKLASAALAAAVAAAVAIGVLHNRPAPTPAPPASSATVVVALDSTHNLTVAHDDSGNVRLVLADSGMLVQTATGTQGDARTWSNGLDSLLVNDTTRRMYPRDASYYLPSTVPNQSFAVQYYERWPADSEGLYLLTATRQTPEQPAMQVLMSRAAVASIVQAVRAP